MRTFSFHILAVRPSTIKLHADGNITSKLIEVILRFSILLLYTVFQKIPALGQQPLEKCQTEFSTQKNNARTISSCQYVEGKGAH
jgi:hypothetical protein